MLLINFFLIFALIALKLNDFLFIIESKNNGYYIKKLQMESIEHRMNF